MIITKGQINDIIITATEKVTIQEPVFLFEFINKETEVKSYCISENITTLEQYDEFDIEETENPDPLIGQVNLLAGEYKVNVYQQVSETNLDPANTTPAEFSDTVHEEILNVFGAETTPTEYEGAPIINTTYEPQA